MTKKKSEYLRIIASLFVLIIMFNETKQFLENLTPFTEYSMTIFVLILALSIAFPKEIIKFK